MTVLSQSFTIFMYVSLPDDNQSSLLGLFYIVVHIIIHTHTRKIIIIIIIIKVHKNIHTRAQLKQWDYFGSSTSSCIKMAALQLLLF